jgi:hypothetical protein
MTIISHRHQLIFLKPRKTAGTSVENALLKSIERDDWVATSTENEPLQTKFWSTPNRTNEGPPGEKSLKRLLRRLGPKALKLREHMPAQEVAALVGPELWARYTKVSVVRNPWDRMISLWRWRKHRDGLDVSFDQFLSAIESGSRSLEKAVGARRWSNVPFYAIDDRPVLDRVLRFENLAEDFEGLIDDLSLPDPGPLPRIKVMSASNKKAGPSLTEHQIKAIALLCQDELKWFAYRPPS